MHYFFVPNRLLWANWENFITNKTQHAFPRLLLDQTDDTASLANYLGLPLIAQGTAPVSVSALPFAAYQMIYNEYYRDQNLIPEVNFNLVDGNNSSNTDLKTFRTRAWEHDYFTAALPTAQQGAPVAMPLGQITLNPNWQANGTIPTFVDNTNNPVLGPVEMTDPGAGPQITVGQGNQTAFQPNGSLEVGATTINELRRAYKLQEWLEKSMRSGQRYIEAILAHFGVRSSDARLQRPEYITGSKNPVVISEVLNTAGETGGLPQGNQAGHAIAVTNGRQGDYYCEEHGYVIGIMSVLPKTAYQQGIPKYFLKTTDTDFAWPEFANLGEQEVLNKELYADHPAPDGTFGYVPRYSELKYMPSRVAGQFQTSLDFWHMGRIFSTPPALNQQFVEADPTKRIFAVTSPTDDELFCHVFHQLKVVRKLPFYGTPTF